MSFFEELEKRGIIYQCTGKQELKEHLHTAPRTFYFGIDPTADSLHVGQLFGLITVKRFQDAGHKALVLMGGVTGSIGDPSFKATERKMLSLDQIQEHQKGIEQVLGQILDPQSFRMVNNVDWLGSMTLVSFLRDIGKHFSMGSMMSKDSVKTRLKSSSSDEVEGISYTEFSYSILQAYDFYHLHQKGCTLQLGGSDQWGNITAGTELIRKKRSKEPAFGLTFPLITKADGSKFGKTEAGTLWLSPHKTSALDFYQFFYNLNDQEAEKFLPLFSFLSLKEIQDLILSHKSNPSKRLAQNQLASEMTQLVHGKQALSQVQETNSVLFSSFEKPDPLTHTFFEKLLKATPHTNFYPNALSSPKLLSELLVEIDLCSSKNMARKDIMSGCITVNWKKIEDMYQKIDDSFLILGHYIFIRKGKKMAHLLIFDAQVSQ